MKTQYRRHDELEKTVAFEQWRTKQLLWRFDQQIIGQIPIIISHFSLLLSTIDQISPSSIKHSAYHNDDNNHRNLNHNQICFLLFFYTLLLIQLTNIICIQ